MKPWEKIETGLIYAVPIAITFWVLFFGFVCNAEAQQVLKISDFSGGMSESKAIEKYPQNQMVEITNFEMMEKLGRLTTREGFIKDPLFVDTSYFAQRIIKYEVTDTVGNEDPRIVVLIQRSSHATKIDTASINFYDIAGNYITQSSPGNIDADSLLVNEGSFTLHNEALRIDFSSSRKTTDDAFDNLWYGIIDQSFFDEDSLRMRYKSSQHLVNNHDEVNQFLFSLYSIDWDGTIIRAPIYRATYTYDGYQETTFWRNQQDSVYTQQLVDLDSLYGPIGFTIEIDNSFLTANDTIFNSLAELNKRVTGINIYRAVTRGDTVPVVNYADADFYLVNSVSISDTAWYDKATDYEYYFIDSIPDVDLITQPQYHDRIGHYSANDKLNAGLSIFVNERRFVADVYRHDGFTSTNGRTYKNRIYWCSQQTGTIPPSYAPDSFGELNFFRIGEDWQPITALAGLLGRLYVFKEEEIYIISLAEPIEGSAVQLLERGPGCINHRSLVMAKDMVLFVGKNGIYKMNGLSVTRIDYGMTFWKDDPEELLGWYNEAEEEYWLFGNGTIFMYNVLSGFWKKHTIGNVNNIVDVVNSLTDTVYILGKDGDGAYSIKYPSGVLGEDSIYNMKDTTTYTIESPRYNMGTDFTDKEFMKVALRFNTGTGPDTTLKFYFYAEDDTVTTADSQYVNFTGSGEQTKLLWLPPFAIGTDCHFKITSECDSLEISSVEIMYDIRERSNDFQ